jgi:hypothetical protein
MDISTVEDQWPCGLWCGFFGRSLAGIVGSNPDGVMDVSLVSVVCCLVEVSASG